MAKIEVCDICGKVHKNLHEVLGRGLLCEECRGIGTIDDLRNPISKRVKNTYSRLKAFEELGVDVVEIEKYLNTIEKSLKGDSFNIVRAEIIGNFKRVSELETTLIFANIGELTNKMQQANVALRDEKEKLKKQAESLEKDKTELSDQVNNLNKENEKLNEKTNTQTIENKKLKNKINQIENLKSKEVEYENQINSLNKKIEGLNKNIYSLRNENKKLKNKINKAKFELEKLLIDQLSSYDKDYLVEFAEEYDLPTKGRKGDLIERIVSEIPPEDQLYTFFIVEELKEILGERGLPKSGTKDELIERVLSSFEDPQNEIKKLTNQLKKTEKKLKELEGQKREQGFQDDFSDKSGRWSEYSDEIVEKKYENGEYHVLVKKDKWTTWSDTQDVYSDFILEVDARQVSGSELLKPPSRTKIPGTYTGLFSGSELLKPPSLTKIPGTYTGLFSGSKLIKPPSLTKIPGADARQVSGPVGYYGLIFRKEADYKFYRFSVSSNGYYKIDKSLKKGAEGWETIKDWTESKHIKKGKGINHLKVIAHDSQIMVFVNDEYLATVTDSSFVKGGVGMTAAAYDKPNVHVHFDNFKVSPIG